MFVVLTLTADIPVSAISVVYNFRIAQITRQRIAHPQNQKFNSLSALLFNFFQKGKYRDVRENYTGGLTTYNRNFKEKYYFRADLAAAHTHQTLENIRTVSATELDDILFTTGRNFEISDKSRVTLSGVLGLPTHAVNTLERAGFGVGQVGVGAQLDGLYKLAKPIDFLWGTRYNYFVPRSAFDATGNCYKFTIGSIADVLVALQTSNQLAHGLEVGYDARWGFGINACPVIPKLDELNYMRNNWYLVYKYTFVTERVAHRLLLTFSYGSDARPKKLGYQAFMVWGAWGVAF